MIKSLIYSTLACLLLYNSGCCNKKSISRRYYTIDISDRLSNLVLSNNNLIDRRCEIAKVDIEEAFASQKIANRAQSHEITYYRYNEWAHNPTDIITRILKQFVESQGVFSETSTRFTAHAPEYRIETNIEHLEAVETKERLQAHIAVEFRLVELTNGLALVIHHNDVKRDLADKDLNLFAATISDILFEEMQHFSGKIKEIYQNKPSIFD